MSGELRYDGRVVLVSGSSQGIGRALVAMFAAKGAKVVVNGRTPGPVEETVAELAASGGEAVASVGDVATTEGAEALIRAATEHYGRVDVVVNNAGILGGFAEFGELPTATFDHLVDVNLRGAFNVTRAAWPHLLAQHYGRVLFFPSQAMFGAPAAAHYALSKAGLVGLLRTLSLDGKPHGITVNGIMPFAFTSMIVDLMSSSTPAAQQGAEMNLSASAPAMLDPRLVAPVAGWLAHESCPVTGEILHTGGGRVSRIVLAETAGFYDPDLTAESVRDNWREVCDEAGYTVPADCMEPLFRVMQRIGVISAPAG